MTAQKRRVLLFICMFIAVCSRSIYISKYPGGVHADEAFAGYEAWSLLKYGTDSWGYHNPVYLTVWGGGMSALNSYLMLPFIKIFGLNTISARLPQMLLGILTVYVLYCLMFKMYSETTALWGMFMLAVSPWHIMISRYGMDANLAPAFVLLGIYFYVLGLEEKRYLPISAVFWGLSLYTYAVIWTFVPVFLLAIVLYCLYTHKIKFSVQLAVSGIILFLMALPLLLFVAVNIGIIPEIKSRFMSIPRLVEFRGSEIGLSDLPSNIVWAAKMFIKQDDYIIWNSIPYFGIYYLFSTPFVIIGLIITLKNAIATTKSRIFSYDFLLTAWIIAAFLSAVLQRTNFNRINVVLLAMFILLAKGLVWFCGKIKHNACHIAVVVYTLCFVVFEAYYFTAYQDIISERQLAGAGEALQFAEEKFETGDYDNIYITSQLRHSQVLFYTQYPTADYIDEVKWKNYPNKYLEAESFGSFSWEYDDYNSDFGGIYVILQSEIKEYEQKGFNTETFGCCAVAYI